MEITFGEETLAIKEIREIILSFCTLGVVLRISQCRRKLNVSTQALAADLLLWTAVPSSRISEEGAATPTETEIQKWQQRLLHFEDLAQRRNARNAFEEVLAQRRPSGWLSDVNARDAFEEVLRIQLALAFIAHRHSCQLDPFTLRTAVSLVLKSISSSQRPLLISDPIVRRMLEEIQVYDVHLDQEIGSNIHEISMNWQQNGDDYCCVDAVVRVLKSLCDEESIIRRHFRNLMHIRSNFKRRRLSEAMQSTG